MNNYVKSNYNTTEVTYPKFSADCTYGLIGGLYIVTQINITSNKSWTTGSIKSNTTQVNYAKFGRSCIDDIIAGFSTITQLDATSHILWDAGSNKTR